MFSVLVLGAALMCAQPNTPALTGLWETVDTTRGGIGETIEFRPNGVFVETIAVLVNMKYRLDGNRLSVIDPTPGSPPDERTVRVDGRTLAETGSDGTVTKKERVGDPLPGSSALIGGWRYRHYTGGIAFERYTRDGYLLFRLPMASTTGCFTAHGSQLTLAVPDKPENEMKFKVSGANLEFTSGGKTIQYRKDPNGPWYEREHIDYKQPQ